MKKSVKFSVVIPTRNRGKYLFHCLRTCLNQNYNNYEIIVSDNCSTDNTEEIVKSLDNNIIKYYKTPEPLGMTENFNFALSKTTGDYIIFLGDDDGLLFHTLHTLNKVIKLNKCKVITWDTNFYCWPDHLNVEDRNTYISKHTKDSIVLRSDAMIKLVLKQKASYNLLPILYISTAIHKDIVNKVKEKTHSKNKFFDSCAPDVYSGFAIALCVKKYLRLRYPLSIWGASAKSNGTNQLLGLKNEVTNDFNDLSLKSNKNLNCLYFKNADISTCIVDCFVSIKNNFNLGTRYKINKKNLITAIYNRQMYCICSLEDVEIRSKEYIEFLDTMYNYLKNDTTSIIWFKLLTRNVSLEKIFLRLHEHQNNIENKIDVSKYKVTNIYELASFIDSNINYKKLIKINNYFDFKGCFSGLLFMLIITANPVVADDSIIGYVRKEIKKHILRFVP